MEEILGLFHIQVKPVLRIAGGGRDMELKIKIKYSSEDYACLCFKHAVKEVNAGKYIVTEAITENFEVCEICYEK